MGGFVVVICVCKYVICIIYDNMCTYMILDLLSLPPREKSSSVES